MKRLFLTAALLLPSCMTPGMVPVEGPLVRSVERVVERHDGYVSADESLDEAARDMALAESASASALLVLEEVSAALMESVLAPVMDRHDAYVSADPELDELEREVYLGSTARLRSLFESVPEPVPAQ